MHNSQIESKQRIITKFMSRPTNAHTHHVRVPPKVRAMTTISNRIRVCFVQFLARSPSHSATPSMYVPMMYSFLSSFYFILFYFISILFYYHNTYYWKSVVFVPIFIIIAKLLLCVFVCSSSSVVRVLVCLCVRGFRNIVHQHSICSTNELRQPIKNEEEEK